MPGNAFFDSFVKFRIIAHIGKFHRIHRKNFPVGMINGKRCGKESAELLPMTYVDGEIKQMELVFERREDCRYSMSYLINLEECTA